MSRKVVVLSSGGLDSTTCVGIAVDEVGAENVSTVSIFYGQRHEKELQAAQKVANHYNVSHYEVDLSSALQFSNCSLLNKSSADVPLMSYADQLREGNAPTTEVPLRNGLMLMCVGSIAMQLYPNNEVDVYIGAHSDDAAGNAYPDCAQEFIDHVNDAILFGSRGKVKVVAPFVNCNKASIVKQGLSLSVPYNLTTSCYNGRDKACGLCGTCRDRIIAFKKNNAIDPIDYEIDDPFREMR